MADCEDPSHGLNGMWAIRKSSNTDFLHLTHVSSGLCVQKVDVVEDGGLRVDTELQLGECGHVDSGWIMDTIEGHYLVWCCQYKTLKPIKLFFDNSSPP